MEIPERVEDVADLGVEVDLRVKRRRRLLLEAVVKGRHALRHGKSTQGWEQVIAARLYVLQHLPRAGD